ncbi:initiation of chromosome replication protein [Lactobacillus pasteurii DSM 23907 = CRBIP 24.76]|nr:initiation of chromosome replication protein [Lactobacillus pasteurii DSM 23907 = CRBIP 24.76]
MNISDAEFVLIVQLEAFFQKGDNFPSNEKIAANTNMSVSEIAGLIQRLIEKNYLTIEQITDNQGRIGNCYSLAGLYDRLEEYLTNNVVIKADNKQEIKPADNIDNSPINLLLRKFEIEFGRYLSPIEREEIAAWIEADHYSPDIIELALRESVLSQVYSLKYVDRILLNWQRHNLKTAEDVSRFLKRNR